MGGTSKKHETFVSKPMGKSTVDVVPGIGKVMTKEMKKSDVIYAKHIYARYLKKSEERFKTWIRKFGANTAQVRDVYNAMDAWDEQHN